MFWFSVQILSETLLIIRRNERNMIKNYILVNMQITLYSIIMKLEFSRQIFEES